MGGWGDVGVRVYMCVYVVGGLVCGSGVRAGGAGCGVYSGGLVHAYR